MQRPSWDKYFLDICEAVSKRSLDENTKLGCVIVNKKNRIFSTGYNSLPAGVDDTYWPKERNKKLYLIKSNKNDTFILDKIPDPFNDVTFIKVDEITKLDVFTHAEINALVSAERSLAGCKLYCTYLPCAECAKAIITAGISEVVYIKENPRFEKSCTIARELFSEAGINLLMFRGEA